MPTLVIKSFPDDLHARLKEAAAEHRRSVTQETIYLIEQALSGNSKAVPDKVVPSYWANRELLPEFKEALADGAFSSEVESTEAISQERDER
ncbi:MAG: hypothetical protein O3B01_09660 [Planctomycetota bacterium]|nr:hypothetical protein [Planctomycetota bacterium]